MTSKFRDHYDWIVLGTHPGALLSAAMAAKLGLSVLVLPMSEKPSLASSLSGQVLDFESNFILGLGDADTKTRGLFSKCLQQLGWLPGESSKVLGSGRSLPQVLTRQGRLVFGGSKLLQTELYREFGKEATLRLGILPALKNVESGLIRYWALLPERYSLPVYQAKRKPYENFRGFKDLQILFREGLDAKDSLQRLWKDPKRKVSSLEKDTGLMGLREMAQGLSFSAVSRVDADPSLQDFLHVAALSRVGGGFEGGLSAFRAFLCGLAERHGAEVHLKSDCRQIFVENGRIQGIQIANRSQMVSADSAILGCGLDEAKKRMTYTGRSWSRKLKAPLKPIGWKFTLALTVHAEVIPAGMQRRVVWQEKGAPVLELEVVDPESYGVHEPQNKFLFVRTVLPYENSTLNANYQRLIASRMLKQVSELIPFLEFHVTRVYPDLRGESKQKSKLKLTRNDAGELEAFPPFNHEDLVELYGFNSVDTIPETMLCYPASGLGVNSGIQNLFLASPESYPSLGTLGGAVAAIEAVAWAAHKAGLRGPLA